MSYARHARMHVHRRACADACRRCERRTGTCLLAGEAGAVDEELLTGAQGKRADENLPGGECGHRERGRGRPAGCGRLAGKQR